MFRCFKHAAIALPIAVALLVTPALASATVMLAKISGDWNDDPYMRSWNVEFRYNPHELGIDADPSEMRWSWNRLGAKSAVQYFKATFVRDTCADWDDDCASTLETFNYAFTGDEINSIAFSQLNGYLYSINLRGPNMLASFGHYLITPPHAPPTQDFYLNDDGDYTSATLRGDTYGGIHTHIFDLKALSVPEPGTWAMMILGFGLAGTALRQKRLRAA